MDIYKDSLNSSIVVYESKYIVFGYVLDDVNILSNKERNLQIKWKRVDTTNNINDRVALGSSNCFFGVLSAWRLGIIACMYWGRLLE
jgi:hypothetical protein